MTKLKKKLIGAIIAVALTTGSFIYSTFAYFSEEVNSNSIVISMGVFKTDYQDDNLLDALDKPLFGTPIDIMPGQVVKKNVLVKNVGTIPVYVRAKLTANIQLSEREVGNENLLDYSLIEYAIDTEHWQYQDGYYYYLTPLHGGKSTKSLLSSVTFSSLMGNLYKDSSITLTVNMEIVQSNGNGPTVFDATGWPVQSPTLEQGGGV